MSLRDFIDIFLFLFGIVKLVAKLALRVAPGYQLYKLIRFMVHLRKGCPTGETIKLDFPWFPASLTITTEANQRTRIKLGVPFDIVKVNIAWDVCHSWWKPIVGGVKLYGLGGWVTTKKKFQKSKRALL